MLMLRRIMNLTRKRWHPSPYRYTDNPLLYKQCYLYRTALKNSITGQEKTKKSWEKVMEIAKLRRLKNKTVPFPILIYEG